MATTIRAEISENSKYYIGKHRYYELKHFCLQYPSWKREYSDIRISTSLSSDLTNDLTAKYGIKRAICGYKIELLEKTAMSADPDIYPYILKGVTEGLGYTYLKTQYGMPCGRDMYYDRYRKFFWLLSEERD